ncbi:MAG TPA: SRPBCC family protein [Mycobacteriales bacterium]|nr:SRPBCC family protein [Mycobacteriales bacterium]
MTSYRVSAISSAPPEQVFAVLADGAGWSRWAGPLVIRSWWVREGSPPPGGVGAIRALGLERFGSREEIVAYDPPRYLAYRVLSGFPVRSYRADVHIEPHEDGARIEWSGSFVPKVPGTGPALRLFLIASVGGFARRLARFAAESA